MIVDVDCDRTIDFPEFLQLMARKQDEDYRLRGGDQGGLQIKVFDMDGSDLISGSELPTS
jgi:Ca2+-binding EF-hand superfamily protein